MIWGLRCFKRVEEWKNAKNKGSRKVKLSGCQRNGSNSFEQPTHLNGVWMSLKSTQSTTLYILGPNSILLQVVELSHNAMPLNLLYIYPKLY